MPRGKDTLESKIHGIWSKLLGRGGFGHDADFFDLGGDSIMALNMLHAVQHELGIEMHPGMLFENPTLRQFAAAAAEIRAMQPATEEGRI